MIRVLRAVGMVVIVAASVVMVAIVGSGFLFGSGARRDKRIDAILSGPSAVVRFRQQHAGKIQDPHGAIAPLVQQAKLFAGIINPPQEIRVDERRFDFPPPPPPPPPVVNFTLLGTSCAPDSKQSFAYIRLPGQASRWVYAGEEVGRSTLKEIRDGLVAYWDGARDMVMAME